jgi:hypothetical protein
MMRRTLTLALALLLLGGAALTARAGGNWRFQPELGFELQYSTNPFAVSEAQEVADTGTASAALGARLPLTYSTRRSAVDLTYAAILQSYNQFDELDTLDQGVQLGWRTSWSRRSSFDLSYTFRWYTEQGRIDPGEVAEDSPVLVRRARISRHLVRSNLVTQMSRKLDFTLRVTGSAVSYDGIDAVESEIEGARTDYQGGGTYRARVGLSWHHRAEVTSEYFYAFQRVREDSALRVTETGEEVEIPGTTRDVHSVGGEVRFPAGHNGEVRVVLGVSQVDRDEERPESEDTQTLVGGVSWEKGYRGGARLETGYAQRVGSSYGTGGVATLRGVFLGYNKPFGPKLSGRVAGNYTEREAVEESDPTGKRKTLRLNGEIVRSVGRTLGIIVGVRWIRQDALERGLVISDTVYRLGLRWYPRGWS